MQPQKESPKKQHSKTAQSKNKPYSLTAFLGNTNELPNHLRH